MDDEESAMKCPICRHGETRPGGVTVTLEKKDVMLVFKDVPAEICDNCGEAFHSEEVSRALLAQAGEAARSGVEIDVRRYAAV